MKLWIARDEDGRLRIHPIKPYLIDIPNYRKYWCNNAGPVMAIGGVGQWPTIEGEKVFPEVTFENSPREVELKLI